MSPRPFRVDPAVLARIRRMEAGDVPVVAAMHADSMGNTLWGRLGERFLRAVYRALLEHPSFLGWVYVEDGQVRGFIAGTEDPRGLMRHVALHRGHRLLPRALVGLARRPWLAGHLLLSPVYFRRSAPAQDVRAESLFCAFAPDLRGKRVSGHINKVLFDELAARGHQRVKITTEVDNPGANRQLRSWGFQDAGHFDFYGKPMVCYVLDLDRSPRVEARVWERTRAALPGHRGGGPPE